MLQNGWITFEIVAVTKGGDEISATCSASSIASITKVDAFVANESK